MPFPVWIVILAVVWFFYSGDGDPVEGALNLLDTITGRGARVTHAPANDVGIVEDAPEDLAVEAGVSLNVYALARNLASEEPHSDPTTKAAIAWCCVNEAARRGSTVSAVLLKAKRSEADGRFGSQKDKDPDSPNYQKSDRYATTALDPYDAEITIAQGVLDGTIEDFTGGCQQYDRAAGEKNPDAIAAARMKAGAELVDVPGTDPGLRFWRT